jgi:hypothetical protein
MTAELEKAKFYLDEAHTFFDFMNETRRKIDDKIYNMITLSGALITIVFGIMSFVIGQKVTIAPVSLAFSVISSCFFLMAVMFGLIAYKPVNISTRNIVTVIEKYEKGATEYELESPVRHIAWNLSQDAGKNEDIVKRKGKWFRCMLGMFFVGLAFLIVALGLLLCG